MQQHHDDPLWSRVTALFSDHALTFALPTGATFEDLVDRLTALGGFQPVAVIVNLAAEIGQTVLSA